MAIDWDPEAGYDRDVVNPQETVSADLAAPADVMLRPCSTSSGAEEAGPPAESGSPLPGRCLAGSGHWTICAHLREEDYDIRTVKERIGHREVSATMIYTHVLDRGPAGVRSPADRMFFEDRDSQTGGGPRR